MKLYRFVAGERVRLGVDVDGVIYDAAAIYQRGGETPPDVVYKADLKSICCAPDVIVVYLRYLLSTISAQDLAENCEKFMPDQVRILPPIPDPEKFICIALNYMDHCEEQNKPVPPNPVIFSKFWNAICGHKDPVLKPLTTRRLDFEGELAVMIGTGGRRIPKSEALSHVFGYTIVNDITARDLQKQDGQFVRAKSQDSFGPMGPCIITADEIPNPNDLMIQTRVNGEILQNQSTGRMIFDVPSLLEFVSQGITLKPGDIISTGTPAGVGVHRNPPRFLEQGDKVEIEIQPIGVLANTIMQESA